MPFPENQSVAGFFQEQVRTRPESLAVKHGQRLLTYRDLDLHAGRVANELRRHSLAPAEPVIVLLTASCELLMAIIGILKAGGAYVPVDTKIPAERLNLLIKDCGARLVLSDSTGCKRLQGVSVVTMDLTKSIDGRLTETAESSDASSDPNRLAYITYTSGSTGQPKGVETEHHGLSNLVGCFHRQFNVTNQDRTSMFANVAFDASVLDIWPVLSAGGALIIPPEEILLDPDGLIAWLASEAITFTFVPTGMAEILFGRSWPEQMKLRYLITGGDRLRVRPPIGLPFVVINAYGPTENTVVSTWSQVTPESNGRQAPPIGRPLDNTNAYVLDELRQPVAMETAGELYLGGEQVARGYLGRPDLTNEHFLPDPFAGKPGARMYRTGDWVRWLPDGELEFLGRKDGQIQIRGRRVELGEIEAALFTHAAVRQVCCVPLLDGDGFSGVIAYVVAESPAEGFLEDLRSYIHARLPDYMVPARFVLRDNLPLTPQGKLDRALLTGSAPVKRPPIQDTAGDDGLEKALARLWQSLLPCAEGLPLDATFSELGGDSLLTIKLMLGVEEIIGQRLETSGFLVQPTFGGLCLAVKARMARTQFQPLLTLRKTGNRPPIFLLFGHSGDIEHYFGLTEALGDDQPVIGLRSPALEDQSKLPNSIEEAAAEAIRCIRKLQPKGPLALVGYSWAGLLAFEVARQLEETEGVNCFTALIGASAPMRPMNAGFRLAHFAAHFPYWLWCLVADPRDRMRRLARWRAMFGAIKPSFADVHIPIPDWASSPVSRHLIGLMEKYRPASKLRGQVDLFRERDEYQIHAHPLRAWQTSHLPDDGWDYWTRKQNRVHWVGGNHEEVIKPPAVFGLAQSLRKAMDQYFLLGSA